MNGKIVFVVPDKKLADLSKKVINELNEDIEVYQGSFSKGLIHARRAINDGANIIISRGGTAELIKRNVNIPVVNIEFGSFDVINSIDKATG